MAAELRDIIQEAVRRTGDQGKLAEKVDAKGGSVSRWLKPGARPELMYCLRIAQISGHSAADVLRAAGRDAELALIESCFGSSRATPTVPVPADAGDILKQWSKLTEPKRQSLLLIAKVLENEQADAVQAIFRRKRA